MYTILIPFSSKKTISKTMNVNEMLDSQHTTLNKSHGMIIS